MIDTKTGETWRFMVNEHDGTITRGRAYQLPSDWTSDSWSHYWDGDGMVGFTIDWHYGTEQTQPVAVDDDNHRAMEAYRHARIEGDDVDAALDRLAVRLTGQTDQRNPTACFIFVSLDRGTDFYALSWGGDPEGEWRDEIVAVNNGDIWRIECEEFVPGFGPNGSDWVPADEYPNEFYGETVAQREFERVFDLPEFPAELLVTATD